jgi:hypothetical protein
VIKTIKIVIEGEVDEIILKRIPGDGYVQEDMVAASFILRNEDREFRAKSRPCDWASIADQCGAAMSGDEVSITGDIPAEGLLVGQAVALSKVESIEDFNTSGFSARSEFDS